MKKNKKIISVFLSCLLVFTYVNVTAFAQSPSSSTTPTTLTYTNELGKKITVISERFETYATAKVYVDGILVQKSIADATAKTINTEVYNLTPASAIPHTKTSTFNKFTSITTYRPLSTEKITISESEGDVTITSLLDEPVTNAGLSPSPYGDGYYYLGYTGGYYYAPDVYGYLYRSYTQTYDGETSTWQWGAGETLGAIYAYLSLFSATLAGAIIGILVFTVQSVLSYDQAVEAETYTFDYHYKVRVYGTPWFTTYRNITYWKITNTTTNTTTWEEKSFNDGFSMSNSEMVKAGIDNYLESLN